MTQTTNGIEYPQEPMLLVRPCLIDICARVRPAAKMLSALLYHARGCTDDVFHVYRSQSQLVSDTIDEVCEKTLCDVATPVLRILGFIEADANSRIIHYTVHLDRIRQAVNAYKQGVTSLITLLRQSVKATLELVLKSLEPVLKSLELVLKSPLQHKNQFQCSLEPVLMFFRASSKVKRGRKPKPEEQREAQSESIENKRESIEIDTGESKENISVTVVTDEAPFRPYIEGHAAIEIKRDDLEALTARLMEDVYRNQPPTLSTPGIHNVDTESHIAMPTRKEEEHGNRIDRSHLHARSLLRTDSSDVVSDIRRTDGDQERVAHSQREAEISNTEGGSNAGVTHVGVPDGYRDRDIAGGEHHRAGVAHTQEIGETDGPDTQYNRDSRGSHPRPDTLLAVPGGGDLHHDTHHQGYLQGAQRGVEAAPKTPEQPHAVQNQFTAPANMVGETSPPVREMRKRTANKKVPTPEELALQERCRGMQATINEWRGYGLTKQGAIINEHKCVRALCEQYTDEQIRRIRYYLFSHHWRWSKPDNRYTIGACTILEEAGNVTQILKNGTAPAKKTYQEEELVEWQGRMMTEEEANKLGFNGGFGAYL